MTTIADLSVGHDVAFGLLLMALLLVIAERLVRHVEDAARRRAGRSGEAAQIPTGRVCAAEEG